MTEDEVRVIYAITKLSEGKPDDIDLVEHFKRVYRQSIKMKEHRKFVDLCNEYHKVIKAMDKKALFLEVGATRMFGVVQLLGDWVTFIQWLEKMTGKVLG